MGFSFGYMVLLDAVGIECDYETSNTHLWTLVNIDGNWVYVDCTWDHSKCFHNYSAYAHTFFGLPAGALVSIAEHECNRNLPVSDTLEYCYLVREGLLDDKWNAMKQHLQKQFEAGVWDFDYKPSDISVGNGWYDNYVEFNLLAQMMEGCEFSVGEYEIETQIEADRSDMYNWHFDISATPPSNMPEPSDEIDEDPEHFY